MRIKQTEQKNWEDELLNLAEKYCKHDAGEMNNCLFWIFKPFMEKHIQKNEKAFGGCNFCYGKGYATTIEFAQSCSDFGNEKIERWKLPEMRFCKCDRGKQLKGYIQKARQEERRRGGGIIQEEINKYPNTPIEERNGENTWELLIRLRTLIENEK